MREREVQPPESSTAFRELAGVGLGEPIIQEGIQGSVCLWDREEISELQNVVNTVGEERCVYT